MEGGIDEAGRGPVMGPLVVAGVAGDPAHLAALGVKDSKRLAPTQRQRLARLLEDDPAVAVVVERIEPHELDAEMADSSLNEVVLGRFIAVGRALGCSRIVVDAADVDAARFGRRIRAGVGDVEVVSEHKADDNHPVVAAASIIAKVTRDEAITELARRLERRLDMALGSGYPSDEKTIRFLQAWLARFGALPEGTRMAWKTAKRLLQDDVARPTRLQDFV